MTPMSKITSEHIRAAYEISAKVSAGEMKRRKGADQLRNVDGLNINTAMDFITQYQKMMVGRKYTRAMSSEALDYFLLRLKADKGDATLQTALTATWQHITYYEAKYKSRMHRLRGVAELHGAKLSATQKLEVVQDDFEAAVVASKSDSSDKRRDRLAKASKKPTTILVTSIVYRRNPDVVAEVLARAAGLCEGCGSKAPFRKKATNEPYLEVHHKTQLALGGDDMVENAEALCPNCHRNRHHG